MCVKVSGEGKWCGKEEGRARGRCLQIPEFLCWSQNRAVFTSMCWSESERGWYSQAGEEERLEAGPAEAATPRRCPPRCLPRTPRMPQWEMGCGFPSLALLFGWNFRKKIHRLRKKGISFLFCDSILPLKDTLPSFSSSLSCQGWGSSWN